MAWTSVAFFETPLSSHNIFSKFIIRWMVGDETKACTWAIDRRLGARL